MENIMNPDRLMNVRRDAYNGYADPSDVLDLIRELGIRDMPCVWTLTDGWWKTTCGRNHTRIPYGDFCPHCGHLRQEFEVTP